LRVFAGQRINIIKQVLQEQKQVDTNSICDLLQVSDVTVRKYFDILEKEGFLKKVHGGAILIEDAVPDYEKSAETEQSLQYGQIAELAVTLLEEGDCLYIGHGMTCLAFAQKLWQKKNLTVITNNVNALPVLGANIENLHFIGGEVMQYKNNTMYTYGPRALSYLDGIFINKAFISVDGADIEAGLTTNSAQSMDIFKRVLEVSRNLIVLADHEKFDHVAMHQFCPLNRASAIVTNEKNSEKSDKYKEYFFQNDIKFLTTLDLEVDK